MKRCAAMGCKESSMVFLLTLLGSMIVCDVIVCGDLRRVLLTTAQDLLRWHERIATRIVASEGDTTGKDYRWE
jgi:hypothetical protein